MAETANTRPRADRKAASSAQGFKAPAKAKEVPAAPAAPDGDLLHLSAEVIRLEAAYSATFPGDGTPASLRDRVEVLEASEAAGIALGKIAASTFTGAAAKARAAIAASDPGGEKNDYVTTMVWSAAEDLVRLADEHRAGDEALLALCERHGKNRKDYHDASDEAPDDALWAAYCCTRDAIHEAKPVTLAGLAAKARAAKAEAMDPDGVERPSNCPAETWAWDLTQDVLRLHDTGTLLPSVPVPERAADYDNLLALTFEGYPPSILEAVSSNADWTKAWRERLVTIRCAFAFLQFDHTQVRENCSTDADMWMDLHSSIVDLRQYVGAMVELLECAEVRLLHGLALQVEASGARA